MRRRHGVAVIFISHDLAVVEILGDEVLVMLAGEAVERGTRAEIFTAPRRVDGD